MPISDYRQISPVLHTVVQLKPASILDVGCGLGIYGALCRIYLEGDNLYDRENLAWNKKENWKVKLDCIEGFDKYITELHRAVYNEIFIGNAHKILSSFKDSSYDIVLAIDILEHLEKEDGITFMRELQRIGRNVIVATPAEFSEQKVPENPLEDHRSHWSGGDLRSLGFSVIQETPSVIGTSCSPDKPAGKIQSGAATVRMYREGDERSIARLFKETFGRELTLEEWSWKYTGRGNKKVYSSVAVNESGEVVAHYGGMPQRMIYKGREISGISICDVMVHTQYRMLKLFKKVCALLPAETVKEGFVLGYGFPNERAMLLPEKLGLYEKVEDVFEAGKEVRVNNMSRFIYKFFPLSYDDDRIDLLWESVKEEIRLGIIRDREYLRCRYLRHPFFSYELWGLKKRWGSRLLGLAVLRKEDERVLLIDFLCKGETLRPLFEKLENYSHACRKKTLSLWFPGYLGNALNELGFSIKPSGTCIPRTTHEGWLKKDDIKGNFFYTMGDTDFL